MSIETDLYSHLTTDAGISALVSNRVYFLKTKKDSIETPYIKCQVVNNADKTSLQGGNFSNRTLIQLDIYSDSYKEVKSVLGAVKTAMYQFEHFPHDFNYRDLYESETGLYRQLIEFNLNT